MTYKHSEREYRTRRLKYIDNCAYLLYDTLRAKLLMILGVVTTSSLSILFYTNPDIANTEESLNKGFGFSVFFFIVFLTGTVRYFKKGTSSLEQSFMMKITKEKISKREQEYIFGTPKEYLVSDIEKIILADEYLVERTDVFHKSTRYSIFIFLNNGEKIIDSYHFSGKDIKDNLSYSDKGSSYQGVFYGILKNILSKDIPVRCYKVIKGNDELLRA